jgi:hypothetical protein
VNAIVYRRIGKRVDLQRPSETERANPTFDRLSLADNKVRRSSPSAPLRQLPASAVRPRSRLQAGIDTGSWRHHRSTARRPKSKPARERTVSSS